MGDSEVDGDGASPLAEAEAALCRGSPDLCLALLQLKAGGGPSGRDDLPNQQRRRLQLQAICRIQLADKGGSWWEVGAWCCQNHRPRAFHNCKMQSPFPASPTRAGPWLGRFGVQCIRREAAGKAPVCSGSPRQVPPAMGERSVHPAAARRRCPAAQLGWGTHQQWAQEGQEGG